MDNKIKPLVKFHKENPDILRMMRCDCPSKYGLTDMEGCRGILHCRQLICWEMALEAVHDE